VKQAIVDENGKQKAFDLCSPHETALNLLQRFFLFVCFFFQAAKEQISI